MGFSESVDAMLSGQKRSRMKRNGLIVLLLVVTLDACCVVFLRESLKFLGLPRPQWTPSALLAALPDFSGDTVDVQLLFILRILTIAILACVAVRVGTADLSSVKQKSEEGAAAPITEPLLINAGPAAAGPACSCSGSSSHGPSCNGGGARKQLGHEVNTEHLESYRLKQAAEQRKNFLIAAVFIASTASQCYVGIKCISFVGVWPQHPQAMTVQGVLMGLSVVFINAEAWLVKRLVNALTKEQGFDVPEFHPHPLYFADTLLHHCDMCRAKTKQSYRCQVYDFDVCPPCFNKKDKATGEGMPRGNKGLKPMETLKLTEYLRRGLRLARPEVPHLRSLGPPTAAASLTKAAAALTYFCSLAHLRLQPISPTCAAPPPLTCGCGLTHLRLRPLSPTVAASFT